jgi:hypothetical protein
VNEWDDSGFEYAAHHMPRQKEFAAEGVFGAQLQKQARLQNYDQRKRMVYPTPVEQRLQFFQPKRKVL